MRTHYDSRDVRTIRLLHEYGFTDTEMADHLDIPPLVVRKVRRTLRLDANASGEGVSFDRRRAAETARTHPAQSMLGGQRHHAGAVILKLSDDRFFATA